MGQNFCILIYKLAMGLERVQPESLWFKWVGLASNYLRIFKTRNMLQSRGAKILWKCAYRQALCCCKNLVKICVKAGSLLFQKSCENVCIGRLSAVPKMCLPFGSLQEGARVLGNPRVDRWVQFKLPFA